MKFERKLEKVINKRDTVILYKSNTDAIKFVVYYDKYKKRNKRKLRINAISCDDFVIADKQFYEHKVNEDNYETFYYDNMPYKIEKPFNSGRTKKWGKIGKLMAEQMRKWRERDK